MIEKLNNSPSEQWPPKVKFTKWRTVIHTNTKTNKNILLEKGNNYVYSQSAYFNLGPMPVAKKWVTLRSSLILHALPGRPRSPRRRRPPSCVFWRLFLAGFCASFKMVRSKTQIINTHDKDHLLRALFMLWWSFLGNFSNVT